MNQSMMLVIHNTMHNDLIVFLLLLAGIFCVSIYLEIRYLNKQNEKKKEIIRLLEERGVTLENYK